MSAVSVAVFLVATQLSATQSLGMSTEQIFNFIVILSGLMLVIVALLRSGNFIRYIPHSVISGFVSGIAILIWVGQIKQLFLVDSQWIFTATQWLNVAVAIMTLTIILGLPRLRKGITGSAVLPFFPPTLIAIIVCTLVVQISGLPIAMIDTVFRPFPVHSFDWLRLQVPTTMSWELLRLSLPLAFELALLCYLDTLMTALIMDKLMRERYSAIGSWLHRVWPIQ